MVAYHWVANMVQVATNLMRAAGHRLDFQQRELRRAGHRIFPRDLKSRQGLELRQCVLRQSIVVLILRPIIVRFCPEGLINPT